MGEYLTLTNLNSIITDATCAAVIILAIIIGCKKGFYKCISPLLITVFSVVSAVLGANLFTAPVNAYVYPIFSGEINKKISEFFSKTGSEVGIIDSLIKRANLSAGTDKIAEEVVGEIVHFALFILIFIIGLLVFKMISKLIEGFTSLALITTIDSFFGLVYGALLGFVILYLAAKVFYWIKPDLFSSLSQGSLIVPWVLKL